MIESTNLETDKVKIVSNGEDIPPSCVPRPRPFGLNARPPVTGCSNDFHMRCKLAVNSACALPCLMCSPTPHFRALTKCRLLIRLGQAQSRAMAGKHERVNIHSADSGGAGVSPLPENALSPATKRGVAGYMFAARARTCIAYPLKRCRQATLRYTQRCYV